MNRWTDDDDWWWSTLCIDSNVGCRRFLCDSPPKPSHLGDSHRTTERLLPTNDLYIDNNAIPRNRWKKSFSLLMRCLSDIRQNVNNIDSLSMVLNEQRQRQWRSVMMTWYSNQLVQNGYSRSADWHYFVLIFDIRLRWHIQRTLSFSDCNDCDYLNQRRREK